MKTKSTTTIKHKIGYCGICGFTHGTVRPYVMVEDGRVIIKPICSACRKLERDRERVVECACCGIVKGTNLYPTTILRLVFDGTNTCNFIVPLCKECKERPLSEIRKRLNLMLSNICESCPDRFNCYTTQHETLDVR